MSNKLIQGSCNSHLPNTINSTSHAVFLTLEEWCNSTYPGKNRHCKLFSAGLETAIFTRRLKNTVSNTGLYLVPYT